MKQMNRIMAFLLAFVMVLGLAVQAVPAAAAAEDTNLALNKPVKANACEGYGLVAERAVDGMVKGMKYQSRWSGGEGSGEQWLQVDLQSHATVSSFQIVWTEPHANAYKIQVSSDGMSWTDVYADGDGVTEDTYTAHTPDANDDGTRPKRFDPYTLTYTPEQPLEGVRYARMVADKKENGYPCISIYEFRVFGQAGEVEKEPVNRDNANLALGKTASAYASPISYWGPDKLVDGVVNRDAQKPQQSRWSSEKGAPGWIMIDLKEPQAFQTVVLHWEVAVIEDYHIEVSDDLQTWKTIYTAPKNTAGHPLREKLVLEAPVTARYVRLVMDKMIQDAYPSLSLYEVEIFAADAANVDKTTGKKATASQGDGALIIDDKNDTVWQGVSGDSVTVDLGAVLPVDHFSILWEQAAPFVLEASANGQTWSTVYEAKEAPAAETAAELEDSVRARLFRVTLKGAGSIREIGLYQNPDFVNALDRIKEQLNSLTLTAEDTVLPLPENVPDSVQLTYLGTDYEQVIDADRNILKPLVDTQVKVAFRLSLARDPEHYTLIEVPVTVPGLHNAADSVNAKPSVIPELQQWFGTDGDFTYTKDAQILVNPALDESFVTMARRFAADYEDIMGLPIAVRRGTDPKAGDFFFTVGAPVNEKETYDLEIGQYVTVKAVHSVGGFWATRSILQIMKQTQGTIPCGLVRDYPKYQVRGLSYDVGRQYVPMFFLQTWVSQMAWYKMNDLGLHMSDNSFDQTFGGFPLESDVPNLSNPENMRYTKDEFRQFMIDAREQGVNVVPEFDTPGHSLPFTEARPDLARPGKKEYLDVQNPGTAPFVQSVFDEYLDGENPVFLKDAVINIGTDEYKGGGQAEKEAFRAYQDTMLKYILSKGHTARAWGSQTENAGVTPIQVEGVQLYMWYGGYANAKEMYDLGYHMININDGQTYIVPGAGYYYDYLNTRNLYNNFDPSKLYNNHKIPAGDPQILGGAYALWNDCSGDTEDNGITDVESLDRLFHALPTMAAKTWGDAKDNTFDEMNAIVEKTGYAPSSNPEFQVDTKNNLIFSFAFDAGRELLDSSLNGYDLTEGVNTEFAAGHEGNALVLKGGQSYVNTPVANKGVWSTIDFWVYRDADSGNEPQVLFESEIGKVMAVQQGTGKLGFTRVARDYSFNYELPKEQWVNIKIVTEFTETHLYVNGEKVDTLKGQKGSGRHYITKWASLVLPLERIGSQTNAFKGRMDDIRLYNFSNPADTAQLQAALERAAQVDPQQGTPAARAAVEQARLEAQNLMDSIPAARDAEKVAAAAAKLNAAIDALSVKLNISSTNMTLGTDLAMNLMVKKSEVTDLTGLSMQVTKTFADGRADVVMTVPAAQWRNYNETYYCVTFRDISAKEMTDSVTAVILKDGLAAGDVYNDSVEAYALRLLRKADTTANLKAVIVDLLNYGAEAQKHFKYNTSAPANANLTAQEKALASAPIEAENVLVKGEKYFGANLNLGYSMVMTMYFKGITPDMHAELSFTRHTGQQRKAVVSGADFVKYNDTVYGIRADILTVADAQQAVTVTVYDAENNVVGSGTDSIASYVSRSSIGELGQAILKLASSAEVYFSNR